ncbi:MAG: porin family protein, partial [Alphaproteobacteria bacterium]|nr:porin family protein [Alphaproteobacteria bacterium]
MRRLSLALAVATLGISSAAMAQGYKGWYLGVRGGVTWLEDYSHAVAGTTNTFEFDRSLNLSGNVGYAYGGPFRVELEIAHRSNDIDSITSGGARRSGATGEMKSLAAMLNGFFDIDTGTSFTPYVGLGVGYARVSADGITATGLGATNGDDDNVFAYQAMAGISYWFTPSVALTADYRYFATQDPSFRLSNGASVDGEYKTHNVMVGLTFRFPEPPPAPRAQPAAAPPPSPPPAAAP